MKKTLLKQVEGSLAELPLEERVKQPLYLKVICAKMNVKSNLITKALPTYHILTSTTGHFGPSKREGKVYPS